MFQKLLNAAEVAELLCVDKQRVYELVRRNLIPFVRVGLRQYRFNITDLERWVENGGSQTIDQNAPQPISDSDAVRPEMVFSKSSTADTQLKETIPQKSSVVYEFSEEFVASGKPSDDDQYQSFRNHISNNQH